MSPSIRLRRWLLALGCMAAGWTAVVAVTHGVRLDFLGLRITSTDSTRPLLFAVALFAIYAWRSRAWRSPSALVDDIRASRPPRPGRAAAALSVALFCLAVLRGVTVAAGADSYGYVTEASMWRHGTLVQPVESTARLPWNNAIFTITPIGFMPSPTEPDHIVPTYAPGLPILMALFQLVFGYSGAFLVVPVCGALTVWLAYLLARRLFDSPGLGLASAILVAASPAFLYQLFWPMSDVPVAMAWTAALVLLMYEQPLAAGLAMSAAIAIRPNLLLLPASALLWTAVLDFRDRRLFGRTWRAGLGLIPGVAGVALVQWHIYGSPFRSGYASFSEMFTTGNAAINLAHYPAWLLQTETPLVLLGLVILLAPRWQRTSIPFPRLLCGGTLAATFVSYLFYQPFDAWWYLRFLLPAWPVAMAFLAGGADALLQRFAPRRRALGVAAVVLVLVVWGVRFGEQKAIFDFGAGELRYIDVASFVEEHTDPRAVIVSLQHSSSLHYYTGRLTVRYDRLSPDGIDRVADYYESIGRHPYLVLDDWEVEQYKQRFAGHSARGALDWRPVGLMSGHNNVGLWDLGADRAQTPETLPIHAWAVERGAPWPVPQPHGGMHAIY